jgi:predicted transglutaminase-like cysteine proteinase
MRTWFRTATAIFCSGFIAAIATVTTSADLNINFNRFADQMRNQFPAERIQVADRWQELLDGLTGQTEREQVLQINAFFHRNIRYQTDQSLYGQNDYWASPLETLGHGRGDCEDWAIAKYISLRQLGISDDKLRLIYVRARIGGPNSRISEAHMVLGYYETPDAVPLIMDSLLGNVLPATQRDDLSPVFSFNAAGLWAGQGNSRANASPLARLSLWRDVIERMQQQGIVLQ